MSAVSGSGAPSLKTLSGSICCYHGVTEHVVDN